jgi:hypothetical protein
MKPPGGPPALEPTIPRGAALPPDLPLSPQARELLGRFDRLWQQGERPALEGFVADCPQGERLRVLVELVHADMAFRLRAGEDARADDYLHRFPELAALPTAAADLGAAEVRLRARALTQAPTPPAPSDQATTAGVLPNAVDSLPRPPLPRRYELKRLLGEGGMGDVWLGRDRRLRRLVAVKVVQQRWAGHDTVLRRFTEEAQLTSQLQHPGIPPVYERGALPDGRPFFCMKVVRGRTLASLLERRAGPTDDLPRLLAIFEQVCEAVAYAHSQGVIHRDLKPANVMVGAFGEVQVMDWGLAKVLKDVPAAAETLGPSAVASVVETDCAEQAEHLTQAGTVLGTFAYMPPEQARGEVAHLDRRCDVFGLGAMLCEILTGKPPYLGSREEVRLYAQTGFTQAALERLASCPADGEFTALARSCLSAKAADRPADAGAVAAAVSSHRVAAQERLRQAELERAAAARRDETRRTAEALRTRNLSVAVVAMLLLGIGVAVAFAIAAVPQDPTYHAFADARSFFGVPSLFNVLSNAPFLLVGALGLALVLRCRGAFLAPEEAWPYLVFFAGVALTGLGSGYYHLRPTNDRLVWDRLPIAMAFMALFAAVIGERISARLGLVLLGPLMAVGLGSVFYWAFTEARGQGDLRPYYFVQYYPQAAIPLLLLVFPARYTRGADLLISAGWYVAARLCEQHDAAIYRWLDEVISGHTIKHLLSAVSMLWVLRMLWLRRAVPSVKT